jgi:hypothetical protein
MSCLLVLYKQSDFVPSVIEWRKVDNRVQTVQGCMPTTDVISYEQAFRQV